MRDMGGGLLHALRGRPTMALINTDDGHPAEIVDVGAHTDRDGALQSKFLR